MKPPAVPLTTVAERGIVPEGVDYTIIICSIPVHLHLVGEELLLGEPVLMNNFHLDDCRFAELARAHFFLASQPSLTRCDGCRVIDPSRKMELYIYSTDQEDRSVNEETVWLSIVRYGSIRT